MQHPFGSQSHFTLVLGENMEALTFEFLNHCTKETLLLKKFDDKSRFHGERRELIKILKNVKGQGNTQAAAGRLAARLPFEGRQIFSNFIAPHLKIPPYSHIDKGTWAKKLAD